MNFLLIQRRTAILISLSLISIIIVAAVALFLSFGGTSQAKTEHWPPLTMVYEKDGQNFNGTIIRETYRLEYKSKSDWKETVIASDPIESIALGTITYVGSYESKKGELIESYNSITDDTDFDRSEHNTFPNQFVLPMHIFVDADLDSDPPRTRYGEALSAAATTTKVCYQSECEDNATGLAFDRGLAGEWIVLNDYRWAIPLRVGDDAFIVSELTLHVPKK